MKAVIQKFIVINHHFINKIFRKTDAAENDFFFASIFAKLPHSTNFRVGTLPHLNILDQQLPAEEADFLQYNGKRAEVDIRIRLIFLSTPKKYGCKNLLLKLLHFPIFEDELKF